MNKQLSKKLDKLSWCLSKTNKQKPTGYIGYNFTLFGKDDCTIIKDIYAKTAKVIWNKIYRLLEEL